MLGSSDGGAPLIPVTDHPVAGWLAEFRYKPGWTFTLGHSRVPYDHDLYVDIAYTAEDAYGSGRQVLVAMRCPMLSAWAAWTGEQAFLDWLHAEILVMEHHEVDEWFRFRGARVTERHPENKHAA